MGNCNTKEEIDKSFKIGRSDFEYIAAIGQGALGTVWEVVHKPTKRVFAMKEFIKAEILNTEASQSIENERKILSRLNHPFIVNIKFAFQDTKKLYLGLDIKKGGDLRFHILNHKFNEIEMKFIIACVLEGLEYLHSQNIIHKDIKPENILLNNEGYAFITDFGTANYMIQENFNKTAGTPGYMAPETICRQNHSFVSDFFSVGVILYEAILGHRPYRGKTRREIREAILASSCKIDIKKFNTEWSPEAIDLCNKLLKRKPDQRLGSKGIGCIKSHPWFNDINIRLLKNFQLKPPFAPLGNNNYMSPVFISKKVNILEPAKQGTYKYIGYFFHPKDLLN
jgi:serine/threonine protein kinase